MWVAFRNYWGPELRKEQAASPVADPSQEWKVAKIQRVLINPANELRKAGPSRRASLSEKELKEAKARSRRIAAQLTTVPGPSSKGVLLFNRRKQRAAAQASARPAEAPPPAELPPPPTYAETLSSPPPLTRVRSPPSYSALYPPPEQKMLPGPPQGCGVSGPNPLPKTGILEESAARRAGKKSMFTFVEKPKLGPNPDLLDLVQSADSRKKQKDQGEPGAEDEPFALGAEAANFVPNSAARDGQNVPPADDGPAWSSYHPAQAEATAQPQPQRSEREGGRALRPPAVQDGEVHHRGSLPAQAAAVPVAHHVPASLLEVRCQRLPVAHGLQTPLQESLQALQNPSGISVRQQPDGE
ncbi:PREDICTED: synaptopodin [Pygoscelis adeliae]|uniref:synaptopodin n=1 Tax=Pygoscelis adeliae TaxID=9238 RepID=UPI0004F4FDF0|nr:PREDICTED: synaptopodin [Pygoscelis adeliae]